MVATMHEKPGAPPGVDNVVLVSSDCHIGPTLDQLREYCPKAYLDTFNDFAGAMQKETEAVMSVAGTLAAQMDDALSHMTPEEREAIVAMAADNPILQQMMRNRHTDGHHDMEARRRDMDEDGLAAEIIFHGSQNGQPVPFVTSHNLNAGLTTPFSFDGMDLELAYVGMHMYNAWLGEQCQTDIKRHVGSGPHPGVGSGEGRRGGSAGPTPTGCAASTSRRGVPACPRCRTRRGKCSGRRAASCACR